MVQGKHLTYFTSEVATPFTQSIDISDQFSWTYFIWEFVFFCEINVLVYFDWTFYYKNWKVCRVSNTPSDESLGSLVSEEWNNCINTPIKILSPVSR